ncbi:MAG TPA: ABC transporter substrate-binding protein [Frankiaceae bacterium]|nr:ABC transporter substrate-binding protein [Frankiaceae bacterium]
MHGRSPRHRLIRSSALGRTRARVGCIALSVMFLAAACSGSSAKPSPSPSSPSPSPTSGPKPGGTLRIAGVTRVLDLDPAAPANEQTLVPGQSPVSAAQGNQLIGRLVLRQLYGYPSTDPTAVSASASPAPGTSDSSNSTIGPTQSGPAPDLAGAAPKLTDGNLKATITLRTVRWDVPSGRRVTATDELRALKRLCLPQISSPVRGYLEESVVGYAVACRELAAHPPATLNDLDAVAISGLTTQGDTTLQIQLLHPTNDLTAILALPETAPLPVESFVGLKVTNDPLNFVGDGPYRFVSPQSGETYALSRNPSWSQGGDPLRRAYVDHISVRGGMTAAKVTDLVRSGGADLSLDVPASSALAAAGQTSAATDTVITTDSQSSVVLAVGSRGPASLRLAVTGVRRVLAACIDSATRTRIAAALGSGLATPSDDLFADLSLTPGGERTPSPSPSVTPTPSLAPTTGTSGSPSASPSASATPSGSGSGSGSASPPVPLARCARTVGANGATLTMLIPNTPQSRAVASIIASRLAIAGVRLRISAPGATSYASLARLGGWDLLLAVRPLRYPAPRGVLAPLLDAAWPGTDAVSLRRSPVFLTQLLAANAERDKDSSTAAWEAFDTTLTNAAIVIPLAQLSSVYPRGANVEHAPVSPGYSNADPANVALGSTRPGDPARTPVPTP